MCVGVSHQSPQILPHSITRQVGLEFSSRQPQKVSYMRKVSSLPALCFMIGYWGRFRKLNGISVADSGERPPRTFFDILKLRHLYGMIQREKLRKPIINEKMFALGEVVECPS